MSPSIYLISHQSIASSGRLYTCPTGLPHEDHPPLGEHLGGHIHAYLYAELRDSQDCDK